MFVARRKSTCSDPGGVARLYKTFIIYKRTTPNGVEKKETFDFYKRTTPNGVKKKETFDFYKRTTPNGVERKKHSLSTNVRLLTKSKKSVKGVYPDLSGQNPCIPCSELFKLDKLYKLDKLDKLTKSTFPPEKIIPTFFPLNSSRLFKNAANATALLGSITIFNRS